ncbi:hypothetical protein [Brevibacterium casei]
MLPAGPRSIHAHQAACAPAWRLSSIHAQPGIRVARDADFRRGVDRRQAASWERRFSCAALIERPDLLVEWRSNRLAEVVERMLESPSTAPEFVRSVTTSAELSTGLDAALARADQH